MADAFFFHHDDLDSHDLDLDPCDRDRDLCPDACDLWTLSV